MMIVVPQGATKKRKRLGRGTASGTGGTCGRGTKGQNARSGGGVRPGFEGGQMPLYRRVARRGFSNARFKKVYTPINLDVLSSAFPQGGVVNIAVLKKRKVIGRSVARVKILARGEVEACFVLRGLAASAGARAKIAAAGGRFEEEASGQGAPAAEKTRDDGATTEE